MTETNDEDLDIYVDMKDEVYTYLDRLRNSGAVNMLAAGPYLVNQFDFTIIESKKFLRLWISDFK